MVRGYRTFRMQVPLLSRNYDPQDPSSYMDLTGALLQYQYLDNSDQIFFWLLELEVLYKGVDLLPLAQADVIQLDMVEAFVMPRCEAIYNGTLVSEHCILNVDIPVSVSDAHSVIPFTDELGRSFEACYEYRMFYFNHGSGRHKTCLSIDKVSIRDVDIFSSASNVDQRTRKRVYHDHLLGKSMRSYARSANLVMDMEPSI